MTGAAARATRSEAARAELLAVTHARLQHDRAVLQAANHELEAQTDALRAKLERFQGQAAA